jgi:hypothetical protein
MEAKVSTERPQSQTRSFVMAAIVVVVGILATTLPQTHLLARLPIQNLLKNELHVSRSANAAFFFWAGLAWYFKPFAGILTDAFPLLGSRRRSYILSATLLGTLAWIGLIFTPHAYRSLLWGAIVINLFMVVTSTVVGAFLVETAQASGASGRLTAIRQFVQQACYIINGPIAGYLASIAFGWTAAACGGILFLLVPVTFVLLRERRTRTDSRQLMANAGVQLGRIQRAGMMWAAAGLMALFYIAPGLSTAVFYKQQTDLHMTTQGQGFLQLLDGVGGVSAAVVYGLVCRRLSLKTLLLICLATATVTNLGYLFYSTVKEAQVVETVYSFGFSLAELALMDLAVRATPVGSEGLGYSLMLSVRNLALFGTDWLGSQLLDTYHLNFNTLVIANSVTTAITVPLVFAMPALLVRGRDAEAPEEAPAPRLATQE